MAMENVIRLYSSVHYDEFVFLYVLIIDRYSTK